MNLRKKIISYFLRPFKKGNITFSYDVIGEKYITSQKELIIPSGCIFSGDVKVGKYSTFGVRCFFRGNIEIGNYCQFGADVSFHSRNHPIQYMTTYQNARLFKGRLKELRTEGKITIGHDVWIGHGAIILSNVNVGNGAIIAAGAVVQKDVKPFSIVGGVPAKHIKYRFSEETREMISNTNWWDLEPEEISKMENLFFKKYR